MATPKDEIKETRYGDQGEVRSADIENVSHCLHLSHHSVPNMLFSLVGRIEIDASS